jgi:hypothetical protein
VLVCIRDTLSLCGGRYYTRAFLHRSEPSSRRKLFSAVLTKLTCRARVPSCIQSNQWTASASSHRVQGVSCKNFMVRAVTGVR